ncbi:DUF305 domain-containing protein [Cellulomonas humilata]|uniref:DUF305 domain-containing protein n=1 Tax=Cellulomonas humilata TaxID=144055 RepID=A0A7Y6DW01_9CELL|nr:DUF305 domain-containing protein [Cellulomonas humilata]NUU17001.1 DUF305 domain-containing protein [Cellulomonas humilata]
MAWMSASGTGMTGMDHASTLAPSGDLQMPGMANAQDVALSAATGTEADLLYLQFMISHHEGVVEMAEAAVAAATDDDVRLLARAIVESQSAELAVLRDMLAERGGPLRGLQPRIDGSTREQLRDWLGRHMSGPPHHGPSRCSSTPPHVH